VLKNKDLEPGFDSIKTEKALAEIKSRGQPIGVVCAISVAIAIDVNDCSGALIPVDGWFWYRAGTVFAL